jgi:putative ABC transport system permease protein
MGRKGGGKTKMFLRLVAASFINRPSRLLVIVLSIVIAAGVVSGVFSIYRNLDAQVGRQLRGYGANLAAVPVTEQGSIDPASTDKAAEAFGDRLIGYSPYLYGRITLGRSEVVLVGLRFDQLDKLSPYLKISGAADSDKALVGRRLADSLGLNPGDQLEMKAPGGERPLVVGAVVESGGIEEGQVFVDLELAQALLDKPEEASLAYFSVVGRGPELTEESGRLSELYGLQIKPISRISENENLVLGRIQGLVALTAGVILLISLLSVSTTMTAIVIERRREVALKKALGADNRSVLAEFAAEGIATGLVGGVLGWVAGYLFAQYIGQTVFGAFVAFSWLTLGLAVTVSLLVAVAGMVFPLRMALETEPAIVLKGE